MPKNASTGADGFRIYEWPGGDTPLNRKYNAVEPMNLLSVTSIRTLNGSPFQLVNWQIGNVISVATGTRPSEWRDYSKSKRGRKVKGYARDTEEFPGNFVREMLDTKGDRQALTEIRKRLKAVSEEPRDLAAVRGSVVHRLLELRITNEIASNDDYIERLFELQWAEEKQKIKQAILPDDIAWAQDAVANFWDMRDHVPFVILAQEPQVFNLRVGYAGSADVMMWFLGTFENHGTDEEPDWVFVPIPGIDAALLKHWQMKADKGEVTLDVIKRLGGTIVIGDWKTGTAVYTSHVVQTTAYMTGDFVATDGIIDERLSDILKASSYGLIAHIRPTRWAVEAFPLRQDVLTAFLGTVAHARLLAFYKRPADLFVMRIDGAAEGARGVEATDEEVDG